MFQADIFIWLLGNRFELPCNPKRPWKHKNKDGNLSNESTGKAICHTGITTHSFSWNPGPRSEC